MRGLMHRVLVCVLALAFVASGAMWRHCMAAMPAPVDIAAQHDHDHLGHDAPSHHDHGAHHQHAPNPAADTPDQPITNDHTCGKCCSVCSVVGVAPPDMGAAADESAVLFSLPRDCCTGATIRVDPGIPKRIV